MSLTHVDPHVSEIVLFFCCGYRYMILVTGWYLPIHIPTLSTDIAVASRLTCETSRSLI
jgi:hypothetical protein